MYKRMSTTRFGLFRNRRIPLGFLTRPLSHSLSPSQWRRETPYRAAKNLQKQDSFVNGFLSHCTAVSYHIRRCHLEVFLPVVRAALQRQHEWDIRTLTDTCLHVSGIPSAPCTSSWNSTPEKVVLSTEHQASYLEYSADEHDPRMTWFDKN